MGRAAAGAARAAVDGADLAGARCAPGRECPGAGRGTGRSGGRADRGPGPRARHDAGRGRGAGTLARGDAGPPGRLHGGDGGRRLPRRGAERHRVGRTGGRADGHGPRPAGRRRPEGPAPDGHSIVQRQHAADRRRIDRGPAGDAPQSGPRSHADPGQREAAPPGVDHRLARRQRRGVRLAGARHLHHPRDCAAPGGGAAGRSGGPVRLGRDRRRHELPAQGRCLGRVLRGRHRDVRRWRRGVVPGGGEHRPAARRPRVRQPEPAVRRVEPDQPGRAPQRRGRPDRRRQHACRLRGAADLGRAGCRGRPGALRELRLRPALGRRALRPRELRQQEGDRRLLLPQPEPAARHLQQRQRPHVADRRCPRGPRRGVGRLPDGSRHRRPRRLGRPPARARRPRLLLGAGDLPGRLHAADGGDGHGHGPGRRRARRRRRLRLGRERLARRPRQRPVQLRHRQRLSRPGYTDLVRPRHQPAAGDQLQRRRVVRGHGPGQSRRGHRMARRAVRGRPRRTGLLGRRPLPRAGLLRGRARLPRLRAAGRRRMEPQQLRRLRRPGGERRRRRRLDARRARSGPSASRTSARRRTASCPHDSASCAAA